MARTNIDLDDSSVEVVMTRNHFTTKRDAVNFALRALAAEPMPPEREQRVDDTQALFGHPA